MIDPEHSPHGARYLYCIAVGDNFDAERERIMALFLFAMNEIYMWDGSRKVKNILSSKGKSSQGESFPEDCAGSEHRRGYPAAEVPRAALGRVQLGEAVRTSDIWNYTMVKRILKKPVSGTYPAIVSRNGAVDKNEIWAENMISQPIFSVFSSCANIPEYCPLNALCKTQDSNC